MGVTLSSNPDVWTKWHEQRVFNADMDRVLTTSNTPNLKYINIVRELVEVRFQPKLMDWATRISEQHKKGLHVIKTVVDLRGLKRFKKNPAEEITNTSDIMSDVRNQPNAKEIFRRMTQTTSYAKQFGDKPRARQEFAVLREKPLIKLPCAQVLKPKIA